MSAAMNGNDLKKDTSLNRFQSQSPGQLQHILQSKVFIPQEVMEEAGLKGHNLMPSPARNNTKVGAVFAEHLLDSSANEEQMLNIGRSFLYESLVSGHGGTLPAGRHCCQVSAASCTGVHYEQNEEWEQEPQPVKTVSPYSYLWICLWVLVTPQLTNRRGQLSPPRGSHCRFQS